MPASSFGRLAGGLLLAVFIGAPPAAAQVPVTPRPDAVLPTLILTTVYDDNSLNRLATLPDVLLRVTPGLSISRTRPRVTLTGNVSVDAERYGSQEDLTTANARQNGQMTLAVRPSQRTAFNWTALHSSTTNAAELNTLTGLSVGRQRAERWMGAMTFRRALTRYTNLDLAYDFARDELAAASVTRTQGADVRLGRRLPRGEVYARGYGRHFDFGPAARSTTSELAAAGWTWAGRRGRVQAEGGVQRTAGQYGPNVAVTLGRASRRVNLSSTFGRATTTVIGLTEAVSVDHAQLVFSYQPRATSPDPNAPGRPPEGVRLTATAGASRTLLPTGRTTTFNGGVSILKPLARTLALEVGYDWSLQQGLVFAPGRGDIQRNRLRCALSISPWSVR